MSEFLKKLFSDESGQPSSNRVFGAIALVLGLIMASLGKKEIATMMRKDNVVWGV